MPMDLDTFLVALYTIVDLYQQYAAPASRSDRARGPRSRTARC